MSEISIIVALAHDNAIGRNGDQPYYISGDLQRFRRLTTGHTIIMGRKTFEALPKGALPNRRNIVISRNCEYSASNVEVYSSLQEAINAAADAEKIFIIGGGQIYSQALNIANKLHLTEIDADCKDADTYFPKIDPEQWQILDDSENSSEWHNDPKSGVRYRFICLSRK